MGGSSVLFCFIINVFPDYRLPVHVAVFLVIVSLIVAIQVVNVVGRIEPPGGNENNAAVRELILTPVDDRAHVQIP